MYEITVYFVSENTSKSENGDFFAGVYESPHFSWILLVFYLLALIGSAGMILKAFLFSNNQKRNRGARKMNLFTILVEL